MQVQAHGVILSAFSCCRNGTRFLFLGSVGRVVGYSAPNRKSNKSIMFILMNMTNFIEKKLFKSSKQNYISLYDFSNFGSEIVD